MQLARRGVEAPMEASHSSFPTVWPKVIPLHCIVAVLEYRQPSPRNGAGKRLQNPSAFRALTDFSHHLSFLDTRNKITALRCLHCSLMFSLYTAKRRRCNSSLAQKRKKHDTLVMPAKASQGFQPEIWWFSDNQVARTTSASCLTKYFLWIPMLFVLTFTGPWEFLVLLSVLAAAAFSPPTVCICLPPVQMSLSFVVCCSVFVESLPWNDLEIHSCSPSDLLL